MAQSDQERIDALESLLAALSYRLEDMQKDLEAKFKVMEELLKMKIRDENPLRTIEVQRIGSNDVERVIVDKRSKYEGEGCSCSPPGMPHSLNCKGYWSGPSYEDLKDKIDRWTKY